MIGLGIGTYMWTVVWCKACHEVLQCDQMMTGVPFDDRSAIIQAFLMFRMYLGLPQTID